MANYIAGAFINQSSGQAKKDDLNKGSSGASLTPTNKHFGGMFTGSSDNYIWWQASLQERVAQMFPTPGMAFIYQMANLRNSVQYFDEMEMLVAMEQVSPGFLSWAKNQGHIDERDNDLIRDIKLKIKDEVDGAVKARKYLYTPSYSNKWAIDDSTKSNVIMKFLDRWEHNNIDSSFFSNWVYYKYTWEKNASMLSKLKQERDKFAQWKIVVSSIAPLKSTDRNENWVAVYGSVNKKDFKGNASVTNFTQWYKVDKDLKISFLKEFIE